MIDPWYVENLVCPVERTPLYAEDGALCSPGGRRYPVVDGIPVMLVEEAEQTIGVASASLRRARHAEHDEELDDPMHIETIGISASEKQDLQNRERRPDTDIDPVVSYLVGATNGIAYRSVIGSLKEYPIPELRLPDAAGEYMLDVGCGWGRWSLAAARKGYRTVGVDPSLGAVAAARRVSQERGFDNRFVVADARYLPFEASSFDAAFSYSVFQHFSRQDARKGVAEISRVLKDGGRSLIQMANAWGIRSFYHQPRRGFRRERGFEVRYWTVPKLLEAFEARIGQSDIRVDCFFGLGLQKSDIELMSPLARAATRASEALRSLSSSVPVLRYLADSVYVHSRRDP